MKNYGYLVKTFIDEISVKKMWTFFMYNRQFITDYPKEMKSVNKRTFRDNPALNRAFRTYVLMVKELGQMPILQL